MTGVYDPFSERLDALSRKLNQLDRSVQENSHIGSVYIYDSPETDTYKRNYKPYDKAYIIHLISTYNPQTWELPNKLKLNPLSCSLNGLKCVDKNKLCCDTCFFTTLIKIPDDNADFIEILAERYFNMLSTFHYESCPWKLKAADAEKCYNISSMSMNTEFEMNKLKTDLLLNISSTKEFTESMKCIVKKLVFSESINFREILKQLSIEISADNIWLLKLTMCGWVWAARSHDINIFKCSCCNSFLTDDFKSDESESGDMFFHLHTPWCCSSSIKSLYNLSRYFSYDCTNMFKNTEKITLLKSGK